MLLGVARKVLGQCRARKFRMCFWHSCSVAAQGLPSGFQSASVALGSGRLPISTNRKKNKR